MTSEEHRRAHGWGGGFTLTDVEREAVERAERCLRWQAALEHEYANHRGLASTAKEIEREADADALRGLLARCALHNT